MKFSFYFIKHLHFGESAVSEELQLDPPHVGSTKILIAEDDFQMIQANAAFDRIRNDANANFLVGPEAKRLRHAGAARGGRL